MATSNEIPSGRAAENQFIIGRVQNATNSAEGPVLPPKQTGETRVPTASNLRILTRTPFLGGTAFVIGFDTPQGIGQIREYRLYYAINGSRNYVNAGFCKSSPARFNVSDPGEVTVAFVIQTVMANGFTSDQDNSPSCTGVTTPGTITPGDISGLDLVFGGSAMTPAGLVPYTSTTPGALTTDAVLQFDDSSKNFGNTAATPTSAITTDRSVAFGVDPTTHTSNFTVGDFWVTGVNVTGGAVVATLPSAAGLPGRWYIVKNVSASANTLTLAADGSDTIDGSATVTVSSARGILSVVRFSSTSWIVV